MRYHYDCEFEDDGVAIIPISIGIVSDDDRHLYLVNEEYVTSFYEMRAYYWKDLSAVGTVWLTENVMNKISIDDPNLVPYEQWDQKIVDFISNNGEYKSRDEVELWGYYAAYDHVLLAQVFGPMIGLPEVIPMFTHEIMQIRRGQKLPWRDREKYPEHHALYDAIYQKRIYEDWSSPFETFAAGDGNRSIRFKSFIGDKWVDDGKICDRDE